IWHLSGQMAQKSCRFKGKTFAAGELNHCTGNMILRHNASFAPAAWPASPVSATKGNNMSNRSWFYAANGQQQGPFPEAQLRDLITRGTVRADTLVWFEGMSGWQRAGEIPGLVRGGSAPPSMPQPGGPPPMAGGASGY